MADLYKRYMLAASVIVLLLMAGGIVLSCGFFIMQVKLFAQSTEGSAPLSVVFRLSVDDSHHPDRYSWDFDDGYGQVNTRNNFTDFIYQNPGSYYVTCFAYQERALGGEFHKGDHIVITVTEPEDGELQVTITAEITNNNIEGLVELACDSTVSGGTAPYTYDWDFGDGKVVDYNIEDPYYYYPDQPETYTVQLTVTDTVGVQGISNPVEILVGGGGG